MNEEQVKALAADLGKKNADQVKALFDAARTEDTKAASALEVKLLNDLGPESEHMKAVQGQLDQIATDLKTAREQAEQVKTLNEHIAVICKNEDFLNIKKTGGKFTAEIPLDFKVAGTMLNSGQGGALPKPTWIPGVTRAPDELPFVVDLCPAIPTTSDTVYYVNRTARTLAAAAITEGDALGYNDYTYGQVSASVLDYGAYLKISDNMLGDNDFIAGQINAELPWDVANTLDEAIVAAAISGATAYSAAGKAYALNVIAPNHYDVLRTAINQARASNFAPDAVLVHHDDYTMMELSKATDGAYAIPQWAGNNGLTVSGVRVIPSTKMTTGSYLVGTFKKTPIAMRQNLVLEFGYDADDFTKRMVTARAYVRAAYIFSTTQSGGFITSTFAAAEAAILKP